MRSFVFICVYAAVILGPDAARAQAADANPEDRVRVTTRSPLSAEHGVEAPFAGERRVIGHLLGRTPNTLVLDAEGTRVAIPFASVHEVEVSRGVRTAAVTGALLGAGAGGLLMALFGVSDPECEPVCGFDSGEAGGFAFLIGALGGGVLGWVIGTSMRSERWVALPRGKWIEIRLLTSLPEAGLAITY